MAYEFAGLVSELRPYAEALVQVASENGLNPLVTSTLRSVAEQKRLYENYLAGRSRYPAAPPGSSPHNFGWAFDVEVNDESYLQDLGELWESWGGTWGGRFRDPIHFELGGASAYIRSQGGVLTPADPSPAAPAASSSVWDYVPGSTVLVDAAAVGNWIADKVF